MSRLGTNKRGQIVREQLDRVRAAVREDFTAACQHVQRIVADAVPARASKRDKAEWHAVVDAVVTLALSCSSLDELQIRIGEQSRSLRNAPENAVALSTIHSAKGLEWDTVFIAGAEDGVLPHPNSDDIEEERRVAYVGVTRARRRLGITYSAERYGERSRPSPFLFEIAGKGQHRCIWTGPRSDGADVRLPLITAEEKQQIAEHGVSHPRGSQPVAPSALPGMKGKRPEKSGMGKQGPRKERSEADDPG